MNFRPLLAAAVVAALAAASARAEGGRRFPSEKYAEFAAAYLPGQSQVWVARETDEGVELLMTVLLRVDREPAGSTVVWGKNFTRRVAIPNSTYPIMEELQSLNGVRPGDPAFCIYRGGIPRAGVVRAIYGNPVWRLFRVDTAQGETLFTTCVPR